MVPELGVWWADTSCGGQREATMCGVRVRGVVGRVRGLVGCTSNGGPGEATL